MQDVGGARTSVHIAHVHRVRTNDRTCRVPMPKGYIERVQGEIADEHIRVLCVHMWVTLRMHLRFVLMRGNISLL